MHDHTIVLPAGAESKKEEQAQTAVTLTIRWPDGSQTQIGLDQDETLIGRSDAADLIVPAHYAFVSGRHFIIRREGKRFVVIDQHSTNGARLNNRPLPPGEPVPLHDGDVIRIGDAQFGDSIGFTFRNPAAAAAPIAGFGSVVGTTQLLSIEQLTIGRGAGCDIVLSAPTVARVHAIVERMGSEYHYIRAGDGVDKIIVNDQPVRQSRLAPGDVVQIGPHLLTYDGQSFAHYTSSGFRLDVIGVYKDVKTKDGPLRILDDINLTIMPREFVALVGGSGAGKSTLLDALNGFRPAGGEVLVNGRNLTQHYDSFRRQFGYVPQYDILPTSLKVAEALHYAARLRLPADVSAAERDERIAQALETVEMNDPRIRQTRIDQLSGGQRKRVSIAAELIADPRLFFLDEPGSGLDPGLEKKLMATLRRMADEGRTVVIITHATANIVQVDHVGFLSQGRLAFFGPPQEAMEFFQVDEFADIYEAIENKGEKWRRAFTRERPQAYQKYVVERRETAVPETAVPQTAVSAQSDSSPQPSAGLLSNLREGARQLWTLSQRMIRLTLSDRVAFFTALLVMPLVALLQAAAMDASALIGDAAILRDPVAAAASMLEGYSPASDAHVMVSTMAVLAFLAGAFGSSQELLKERTVYLRERMINLRLLSYVGSKLFVFTAFAFVQSILYLLLISLKIELPADGQVFIGFIELFITIWLTMVAGMVTGLFVSAVSNSSTLAVYLVLFIVFYQYVLGGALFNLRGKSIEPLSYGAAARWGTLALGATADVAGMAEATIVCGNGKELDTDNLAFDPATGAIDPNSLSLRETAETVCENRPVDTADLRLPYASSADDLLTFWGAQLLIAVLFALGTIGMVKRLDRV